ncbi:unnamed protein product, partial [Rotaria sordida]
MPRRSSQNRPRSRSNQRQSRSIQQRRRGPRQLRLNDFMPPQLRDPSPDTRNLPSDFNLATATTTNNIPVDALSQREIFRNNTTQPFVVNQNEQENQQQNRRQQYTSATFRRRQRRNRQNENRFAIFADENNNDPIEIDLIDEEPININKNKKKNSKKTRL